MARLVRKRPSGRRRKRRVDDSAEEVDKSVCPRPSLSDADAVIDRHRKRVDKRVCPRPSLSLRERSVGNAAEDEHERDTADALAPSSVMTREGIDESRGANGLIPLLPSSSGLDGAILGQLPKNVA